MDFMTIKETIQTEIIEKKSKFIANLFPIQSMEEIEKIVKETKKRYYDARHNCLAYRMLEEDRILEKSSDDGEPSGTAGAPMLNILQKNNLCNVLIIVTRYFGGILLGTGGLVRAYSDSLVKAVEKSQLVQIGVGTEMLVTTSYHELDRFKYYCKCNNILITNVEYCEFVSCKIELEDDKKQKLLEDFATKNVILQDVRELSKKYIKKSI